jgi:Sel1 repeat-containing protein
MIRKDPLSSYEDGAAAYNRADYATARRLWLPLAEAGNAEAQTMLGIIYEEGQGVSQDYAAAVTWYRRAADQQHPDAQFYLACMHDCGKGVPIDPAAAANWLTKAADQGHTDAQFSLGVMYEDGIGVSQDHQAAVGWYRKAAEQGHGKAQNNLGTMFVKAQGVPQDYDSAADWFRKAAAQGDVEGQFNLGLMYENGTGVPQDQHAAMTWYRAAAGQGHTAAEGRLQQTQQCATGGAEQKQQAEEKPLKLREGIEFVGAFQRLLREVAASAPGALHRDPVIASTEFSSLATGVPQHTSAAGKTRVDDGIAHPVRQGRNMDCRQALCRWSIPHECYSNERALQQPKWRSLASVQRCIGQSVRAAPGEYPLRWTNLPNRAARLPRERLWSGATGLVANYRNAHRIRSR